MSKPLHGQFIGEISDQICVKSQWLWLRFGYLTKEMKGFVFAAQEHALSTNAVKAHIYKPHAQLDADFVVLLMGP